MPEHHPNFSRQYHKNWGWKLCICHLGRFVKGCIGKGIHPEGLTWFTWKWGFPSSESRFPGADSFRFHIKFPGCAMCVVVLVVDVVGGDGRGCREGRNELLTTWHNFGKVNAVVSLPWFFLEVWFRFIGLSPLPVTVTTRIITFLVGDPYKPSFATVTGRGWFFLVMMSHMWFFDLRETSSIHIRICIISIYKAMTSALTICLPFGG